MTLWYVARAAGLAALLMLSAATALGALASMRRGRSDRRVILQYLHRAAATLGLTLLVAHVTAIVLDTRSGVSLRAVVIPLTSGYRPVAVAMGTVAAYLFVLVAVLGAARGRMATSRRGAAMWRAIHVSAYGGWGLGVLHGFLAGTDDGQIWVRALDVLVVGVVLAALAARLSAPRPRRAQLIATARKVAAR